MISKDVDIYKLVNQYNLSETERKILVYMLSDIHTMKNKSVRDVAADNYVSPATVIKLAKKMNYSGFVDMVYHLYFEMKKHTNPNDVLLMDNSIFSTIDKQQVADFCSLMNKNQQKNIYTCGSGFARPIAEYISMKLLIKGYHSLFTDLFAVYEGAQAAKGVIWIISSSGNTGNVLKIAERAKKNQMSIITFSSTEESQLAQFSDLTFIIKETNVLNDQNKQMNYFYSGCLFLAEFLISQLQEE